MVGNKMVFLNSSKQNRNTPKWRKKENSKEVALPKVDEGAPDHVPGRDRVHARDLGLGHDHRHIVESHLLLDGNHQSDVSPHQVEGHRYKGLRLLVGRYLRGHSKGHQRGHRLQDDDTGKDKVEWWWLEGLG